MNMEPNIIKLVNDWIKQDYSTRDKTDKFYCETRDFFQLRLDKILPKLIRITSEDEAYFLYAIAGEIGNNSFDHNVGKWKDIPGLFFAYDLANKIMVLADRGQGILATLRRVKPDLSTDKEALKTAFTQRISGRAPENRGNGLKFVKSSVIKNGFHLNFKSGDAEIEINQEFGLKKNKEVINGCLAIINFA